MPCGDCCVCGDELDHADAGFCGLCSGAFHWGRCGDWHGSQHACELCKQAARIQEELRTLPALSVRQPWAWLIVRKKKLFENRDWSRGYAPRAAVVAGQRILIHAAKGMTRDEYTMGVVTAKEYGVDIPPFAELERGGIVGWADIAGWHDERPNLPFAFGSGIEFSDAGAVDFMPCKGALGFFWPELPEE